MQDVTLTPGQCTDVSHTFTFAADSMAQADNIIITAWAQNVATVGPADVHQAAQLKWSILDIDFSFDPLRPMAGETVNFTDETVVNGPVVQGYDWDFGDGDTSTLQNPSNGFPSIGCYDVTLEVASDIIDRQITKGVPVGLVEPAAAFSHNPMEPDIGQLVQFTDLSTGDFDERLWDFGDGSTSTEQNPTHTYTVQGDYDVTLTVTNGCDTDVATTMITVCETVPPVADFNRSPPGYVAPGQNIYFSDQSSASVLTRLWDFDDGTTSPARNVWHSFAATGTYSVSLTVSSGCLEDFYSEPVVVCLSPTAAFSTSPPAPSIGQPVQFTDESTGGAVAWAWDFGDGGNSTLQNPTHSYATGGSFTVTLTVSEALGCSDQTTGTVDIVGDPEIFDDGFESGNTSAWASVIP